jgi:hypothetical protein
MRNEQIETPIKKVEAAVKAAREGENPIIFAAYQQQVSYIRRLVLNMLEQDMLYIDQNKIIIYNQDNQGTIRIFFS